MANSTFIRRVTLRNYKSIAACDVHLGPLTFLVGRNGTGKSNFLEALRFVATALRTSLDHALRDLGGINEVRRRSGGHPTHFTVRLDFRLRSGQTGHYAFRIGARPKGRYSVQDEECYLTGVGGSGATYFRVRNGEVIQQTFEVGPSAVDDRLYLVSASGIKALKPLFDELSNMGFYSINPDRMREPQPPDPGDLLLRDGSNVASVLRRLSKEDGTPGRIVEYLTRIIPGVETVQPKEVGQHETLEFKQYVKGAKHPWRFAALNMSDGTLRAVGILVALFQSGNRPSDRIPLIGIEEPEIALHPAAAAVLLDSLIEASQRTQVVVTSHSPELLDSPHVDAGNLLAVVLEDTITRIGSVDTASKSVLQEHLYTAGELLRLDQLAPDPDAFVSPQQLDVFTGQPRHAAPA